MLIGNWKTLAIVVAMSASSVAIAAGGDQATIGEIGATQSRAMLKQAQLKEQLLDNQLRKEVADASGVVSTPAKTAADGVLPNVKMILGGSAGLSATLVYAGGSQAGGRVGSSVPGGYTITAINLAQKTVEVKDASGKKYVLASGSAPQALETAGAQNVVGPRPMSMPGSIFPPR
ncbi:type IV pilus biogenesis protein PilP [Pandoraea communis]|uniref:type IV pilus biogenesis protein PilP n=1 Tax=Pandoraea communis TaxID=2508297 RepID=UPI0025A632C5|nr:type IV pilus biogenesis protein PilP [Pandoraea communis]MDM8356528.1 type IV pilus biogenesis protein PilP [Pandoraea communis]